MTIKAVLFDLDDTLMVEEGSERAAFLAACDVARRRCGIESHALSESVRRHATELWRSAPTFDYCRAIGISSWEGLWGRFGGEDPNLAALRAWVPIYRLEAWKRALKDHGSNDSYLAAELVGTFVRERRTRHLPFPDAEPSLLDLRRSRRLGLISNGAPDIQREKLDGSGLRRNFEVVLISGELGIGKPDARIFAAALQSLGVGAAQAAMVGDNLRRDVGGAKLAGIRAVWLDRSGSAPNPGGISPDARISGLDQLSAVLD